MKQTEKCFCIVYVVFLATKMVKSLFGELCKRDLDSGQIVEDMDALLKNVLYKCQRVKTYMRESLSQKSSLKITPEPWVSFQWWQW